MKKILFLFIFSSAFFVAEAQTKSKKKSRKSKMTTEARVQMRLDSQRVQRQAQIDSAVAYQVRYDSLRKENERLAYEKFQQDQAAWKEGKMKEMDSSNQIQWRTMSKEHEEWLQVQKQRKALNKAAKLNDYQDRQVLVINQNSFEKAKMINADSTIAEGEKKEQLSKLNLERQQKIKTVVGKSKAKKLEKARKANPNMQDKEAQWINEVDGVAKN